jgi:alkyldihydroxyacetonephosphate synthase
MPSRSRQDRARVLASFLGENGLRDLPGIAAKWDELTLQAYSQDLWPKKLLELREKGPAKEPTVDLVVWPESTEQVAELVRWASKADVVLYPYGAGSGVCGATIPGEDEPRARVLVDLKKMTRVRSIDRKSMAVWAEAGLIGENLERHLNQEGLTLGHFPSSIYCSSLGGYLATRSAGQLSTKYGKIEDMVLALECVLPDGTVIETGRAPRSAMGPDFTQFLLGTEGTLCFFTAALLQVHNSPEAREMTSFEAKDAYLAMDFARRLMQEGLRPSALRIYDPLETALTLSSEALKKSGFESGAAIVAGFEGRRGMVDAEMKEAVALARTMGVRPIGPELGRHWWEHRYDISYKQQLVLSHNKTILDTFEIAATWERLEHVYRAVKSVNIGLGVVLAHFSHFYHTGANIYFTLVAHSGVGSAVEHYDEIWQKVMKAAVEAGASLSHHHGVGQLKREFIRREKQTWIPLFERIKRGFDPQNRFNPDKMGL